MLEQQLAEWFRAVVDDEPPLAVEPEELVDRLLRAITCSVLVVAR